MSPGRTYGPSKEIYKFEETTGFKGFNDSVQVIRCSLKDPAQFMVTSWDYQLVLFTIE